MQRIKTDFSEFVRAQTVRDESFTYFTGYHVLDPLIKDRDISDIMTGFASSV